MKKKVLILESNEQYADELSKQFVKEGYEVCGVVGSGAEGLELLKKCAPSVVIMNMTLRGADGFSVLEEAGKESVKTVFIALGSYTDDKIVERILSLGANYYLTRPVEARVVCERAEQATAPESTREKYERKRVGSIDERISNIFISIGIPPHIKGYAYLREGIKMAVDDPQVINNVTKVLYPVIGEKYQTSASKVERAIRHAIEVAWNRGRIDAINAIFGARVYIGTEKPTNSEFIALVADKLLLENMHS